ncbi:MAG: TonB-dependent receptor [Steroidobacteraceae bacterium]
MTDRSHQRGFTPLAGGLVGCLSAFLCSTSIAAETPAIIVTAPLPGHEVPRDRFPADVQTLSSEEIRQRRARTVAELTQSTLSGVSVNETQSNPFQPDVSFRGFSASPLLGNPIGLSVFVDGVRVNESFGDTVLWDLIPMLAIERVDLIPGSNPVFGLNTLGGALSLRTRSGREQQGASLAVSGGSYARRNAELVAGGASDRWDGLAALNYYEEDGWRDHSPSTVRQVFLKGGYTGERTIWHASYTLADNSLIGNGLAPESLLAERRSAVYTYPDTTAPQLGFLTLSARTDLRNNLVLGTSLYRRDLEIETFNGDAEFDDAGTALDFADDSYAARNRGTHTDQLTIGGTLQLDFTARFLDRDNVLTSGLSWDRGRAVFRQLEQDAGFTGDRGTEAVGEFALGTHVRGTNTAFGIYALDSLAITPRLQATASLRFNHARVELEDLSGDQGELDGNHRFDLLNTAAGFTYSFGPSLTSYASYNEGSRIPTAVELACADENAPCSLPVGFVADPPLEAVKVRTWEGGLRGRIGGSTTWRLSAFASKLTNDILFTAVGNSQGFFANVDATRRRGIDLAFSGARGGVNWTASYAYVDATFAADTELFNPVSLAADPAEASTIEVHAGDRLAGIPRHTVSVSGEYSPLADLTLGADVRLSSSQILRGDEHNTEPPVPGHTVVNLRARYQATPNLRLFATLENALDRKYASLGSRNRNAFDADSQPLSGVGPGPVERFVSPGTPRHFWLGFEYDFGSAR